MKVIQTSWGTETIVGSGKLVVRLYHNAKKNKLTLDWSQLDATSVLAGKVIQKYGSLDKLVICKNSEGVVQIAAWIATHLS